MLNRLERSAAGLHPIRMRWICLTMMLVGCSSGEMTARAVDDADRNADGAGVADAGRDQVAAADVAPDVESRPDAQGDDVGQVPTTDTARESSAAADGNTADVAACSNGNGGWPRRPNGVQLTPEELAQVPPSCGLRPGNETTCSQMVGDAVQFLTKQYPGVVYVRCVKCGYWPIGRMPAAPECLLGGGTVCLPLCAGGTECVARVASVCVVACGECQ